MSQRGRRWQVVLVGALLSALWAGHWWWVESLPQPLFQAAHAQVLEDRHGQLLSAKIAADEQWRFPELAQVPEKFAQALISFEDKRFYQHSGVDALALARAIRLNVSQRRVVSGASTLTMQVVRMARGNPRRTLAEKALELLRAWRLEIFADKQKILALYASHAPFGGNIVGLEAAAWRYFGRSPEQLSWAESAMLAVLPNSPALIHPGRNRTRLRAKRDALLMRLAQQGHIDTLTRDLALAEPLPTAPQPLPQSAPHLLDTLSATQTMGGRLRTTLDARLQRRVNRVARRSGAMLAAASVNNLAIVVIDNHTRQVRAYVGNRPGGDRQKNGQAIDMVRRARSTGSTLKPFLLADMIDAGMLLPDTLVRDVPVNYSGFSPQNFHRTYLGAVPAGEAVVRSLNIPAVNMLSQRKVAPFKALLQRLGLRHLFRTADDYGLSLILGGAEASLLELTSAYANLAYSATRANAAEPATWQQASVLISQQVPTRPATLSAASAWMTLTQLTGVSRPGLDQFWEKFSGSRKIAWKTGTSYGHRDAWAIGVSVGYSVGVWVGNADGRGQRGMTGTQSAAPLLLRVFEQLPNESSWFEPPHWQMSDVQLCADDGYVSDGLCPTVSRKMPLSAHFSAISKHYQRIHLDADGARVHGGCARPSQMRHRVQFVLPPDQAFYYRQQHLDYKPLPPWRADCAMVEPTQTAAIALIYPQPNSEIYLPRALNGERGSAVFRALLRDPEAVLYWHLDDQYLGQTRAFHEWPVRVGPGPHQLTLVDAQGNRLVRAFSVAEYEAEPQ